jgi:hypothetical protein
MSPTPTPTEEFNALYITSSEVGKFLNIPRTTMVTWKNNGKLPDPIEVNEVKLTIWKREPLLKHLYALKKVLDERRQSK